MSYRLLEYHISGSHEIHSVKTVLCGRYSARQILVGDSIANVPDTEDSGEEAMEKELIPKVVMEFSDTSRDPQCYKFMYDLSFARIKSFLLSPVEEMARPNISNTCTG